MCSISRIYIEENGQIVINRENLEKTIAAKSEQLAITTALNYVRAIQTALIEEDTEALNYLTDATKKATGSTWDLVYAQLALVKTKGLTDEQYQSALRNINALRSLSETAIQSIGKITGTVTESLREQERALDDLLKYVMDMIRWEVRTQIEGLREQIRQYQEIVRLQLQSLRAAREKFNYERSVARQVRDIAELQARINQLSLDDSREAQAERRKLEKELADLQERLADEQSQYAYDKTVETLNKMSDSYRDEKNREIRILEDSISSKQKPFHQSKKYMKWQFNGLAIIGIRSTMI